MYLIRCKQCRRKLSLPDDWVGKPMSCPGCGQTILIRPRSKPPTPGGTSSEASVAPPVDEACVLEEHPAPLPAGDEAAVLEEGPAGQTDDEVVILNEPTSADPVGELSGALTEPRAYPSPSKRHAPPVARNDDSRLLWIGLGVGVLLAGLIAVVFYALSRTEPDGNDSAGVVQSPASVTRRQPTGRGPWLNPDSPSVWDGFGGWDWGIGPQDIVGIEPVADTGLFRELDWYRQKQPGMKIGAASIRHIDFGFQNGRLTEIRVVCLNSDDRDTLAERVQQSYRLGPAQSTHDAELQWQGKTSGGYPVTLQFGGRTRAFTATTMRIAIEESR